MPYRSRRSRRFAPRARRKGVRRRYAAKPVRYRKRTYRATRRPRMRTILNKTSRKKRDILKPWTNITPATPLGGPEGPLGLIPIVPGNITAPLQTLWIATARDSDDAAGTPGTVKEQAVRTAQTVFWRGVKETLRIETSSSVPWQWRRICFTFKGTALFEGADTDPGTAPYFRETSAGNMRLWRSVDSPQLGTLNDYVFKGSALADWSSVITAQTDPLRITVKYDRVVTIRSGNDSGTIRTFKMWHAMNKNLVYDEDELGDQETSNALSVTSKAGMGDYYIMDIFSPLLGSSVNDQLAIRSDTQVYWHEK